MISFLSDEYPKLGQLDRMAVLFLIFLSILSSKAAALVYIHSNSALVKDTKLL